MNQVTMVGRISREIKTKTLSNGTTLTRTSIAVKRDYNDKNGERITDFFWITLFGKRGATFAKYLEKGSLVLVIGSLHNNNYEKDGKKFYQDNFIVHSFEFLEPKSATQRRKSSVSELLDDSDFKFTDLAEGISEVALSDLPL